MPLFFFLSGFLFKAKPPGQYFKRKLIHLILPYLAYLLLFTFPAIFGFIKNVIFEGRSDLLSFYLNIFLKISIRRTVVNWSNTCFLVYAMPVFYSANI